MSTTTTSLNRAFGYLTLILLLSSCASGGGLPEEKHGTFTYPETSVYSEEPTGKDQGRSYKVLGWVRAKAEYPTLEQTQNDPRLCRNYFNKAARSLLKEAKKAGGDAVIKVRSVVLLMDGKMQEYPTPECADDGEQAEILLRGIAVKFRKPDEVKPALAP